MQQELARTRRPGSRWILEEWLPFERELSILVVRVPTARRKPTLVDNVHEEAFSVRRSCRPMCRSRLPTWPAPSRATPCRRLTGGVFCVELFLMADGRLVINEIAPRPHNSGHYTLDACTVSQFEQQVRTLWACRSERSGCSVPP